MSTRSGRTSTRRRSRKQSIPTASASGGTGEPILERVDGAGVLKTRGDWSDLGPRIASGLALAVGGVAAAWFGGAWIAGACGAAVVIMSYEWARMSEPDTITPAFVFALVGSLGAVMLASWGWLGFGAGWMAACALASATRRRSLTGVIETAGGTLYVGLPCAVFVWLRRQPEGLAIVFALFAIIWAADIFAYFGGKLLGGPKIARGLSPNKTWSGIVCGVGAGIAAGLGCGAAFDATPAIVGLWSLAGAVIAFTGLMGDLFESFLKRRFGVKDASKIIPGHGGLLDRIDGLMAATLLTGAVITGWPGLMALLIEARP